MTDFVQRVREALQSVPHDAACPGDRSLGHSHPHLAAYRLPCDCDRAQRQAERVAAAIEATITRCRYFGTSTDDAHGAALSALREGPK